MPMIFDLTPCNSYAVESVAECCYVPRDINGLMEVLARLEGRIPLVIGGGTNVILMKSRYERPFIVLAAFERGIREGAGRIEVGAGTRLCSLVEYANTRGLPGLERLVGIPGTIGGAVRMNAGAYGQDIGRLVESVETIDLRSGAVRRYTHGEAAFGYRSSVFATEPLVIVRAWLRLAPCRSTSAVALQAEAARHLVMRSAKIPYHLPNAGSVFKRAATDRPIGEMVEALGLKGERVNDAMVSREHAGIIVNTGTATGTDIDTLIGRIQRRVADAFGVTIELEQVRL